MTTDIRPGAGKEKRLGSKFKYVKSDNPGFAEIRNANRDLIRFDSAITDATHKLELALLRVKVANLLMNGGQIDKNLLARSGLNEKMDPQRVLDMVARELPHDLLERALK